MYKIFLFVLACFPLAGFAQVADSVSIKTIDSLILVSRKLTGKRDFDKALEINAEAEKRALEKFGRASGQYANACANHGRIFHQQGNFSAAEKWHLDAYAIRKSIFGDSTLEYAKSTFSLGLLYWRLGKYDQSEKYFLETKAIRGKILGTMHIDYSDVLNGLANVYADLGDWDQCEQLNLEVLDIQAQTLGKESSDYAGTLTNLGNLYQNISYYERAEPLQLEALAIRGRVLGKEHYAYAQSLNNLGVLYYFMGDFEKAEPLLLEARDLREKIYGKAHQDYAKTLNNLANLYATMGNFAAAEPLYLQVKAIREKTPGKQHPVYPLTLGNLASLYLMMGQPEKALPLLLESKDLLEQSLGKENQEYASILNQLAAAYFDLKNVEKAMPLVTEAQTILEKHKDIDYSIVTYGLQTQGNYYFQTGNYPEAEKCYLQIRDIREKKIGKDHLLYVKSLQNLANFYTKTGNPEPARVYLLEETGLMNKLLRTATRHLSEQEAAAYVESFKARLDYFFSFAGKYEDMAAPGYDHILFHKGFLMNAVSQINNLAVADTVSARKYSLLKSYERRLAAEYTVPSKDPKSVAALEASVNSLEKDLTRSVAGFAEALRQVTWQEVQQKLRPGEAAVEFVHYRLIDRGPTDSTMYAALLLLPGKSPVFVPLFEEKQLNALLRTTGKSKTEQVDALYSNKSLYEMIWLPLEPKLAGIQTIYYSPSGQLHRLNLGAVPVQGNVLADRYHLIELNSTRQLVVGDNTVSESKEAVLYGGIQYDLDSVAISRAVTDLNGGSLASPRGLNFTSTDSTLRAGDWNYLKWTDVEVGASEAILHDAGFRPSVLRKYAGTEESFKSIGAGHASPRILHIATHGFFFPDPKVAPNTTSSEREPVFKISDHPMMRAGLVLSGGNYAWKTGQPFRPGYEDGILTAYEISQMNLRNTELVVLSACETGLGDIQGNEGVYGLQRAFKIAGAKYLIMSLWQVPDFQTQELMTTFYSRWLIDKMTIPDAFSTAQKVMREKYKEPFLWAGFVLVE